MSTATLRVLLVDDHPLIIDGLRLALDVAGVEVAGTASTATDAVVAARALRPDVVIMDVNLPDANGITATRQILHFAPHTAVLILTMLEDAETLTAALRSGARGYLVKGADRDEIIRAVHAVAGGEVIIGPGVAQHLLRLVTVPDVGLGLPFPELTGREREVLTQLAAGHSNAAIARQLGVTAKTAANHVSNILNKLGLTDRTQAALRARDRGL